MRLSIKEITIIKDAVYNMDPNAVVYLYGSRINDLSKGGDIDLLILTDKLSCLKDKSKIRWAIFEKLGEQKIDMILSSKKFENNFVKNIFEHAIKL